MRLVRSLFYPDGLEYGMDARTEQAYQKRIAELEQLVAQLTARIAELSAQVARLSKNSANSSKPPSSDIVNPRKPPRSGSGGGKIGGQPGHDKHERVQLPPERIDRVEHHQLSQCPDCGGAVRATPGTPIVSATLQQIELAERPLIVTEHRAAQVYCPHCRKRYPSVIPGPIVKAGLLGPRLTALVGWFKSQGRDSYTTMERFMRDVCELPVSRGLLAKAIEKVSGSLSEPYEALRGALADQPVLNVDETGHPENGRRMWTWVLAGRSSTVFHIDESRGSGVLQAMLGERFGGILCSDYFSAYRKYLAHHSGWMQFCWAHLIRDVKFITTLPDAISRRWAERVLAEIGRMFSVIHRRGQMEAGKYRRTLERRRRAILQRIRRPPRRIEAENLAARFHKHAHAYFTFVDHPGVEPTNNAAERALRSVVIDRKLTQGTRGQRGRQWCQRIWTVAETCRQQGRSLFDYLCAAMEAHFKGQPTPSLLPV